jgi:hypothetical protein
MHGSSRSKLDYMYIKSDTVQGSRRELTFHIDVSYLSKLISKPTTISLVCACAELVGASCLINFNN